MDIRRVVTGHDPEGRSIIASDAPVAALDIAALTSAGYQFHSLWGADETVLLPNDGAEPTHESGLPPIGGFRFSIWTIPYPTGPASAAGRGAAEVSAVRSEIDGTVSGAVKNIEFEGDDVGMHKAPTVECDVILSGELILEVDGGVDTVLRQGDVLVQNGARHRWRNESGAPATLAAFLVAADHSEIKV